MLCYVSFTTNKNHKHFPPQNKRVQVLDQADSQVNFTLWVLTGWLLHFVVNAHYLQSLWGINPVYWDSINTIYSYFFWKALEAPLGGGKSDLSNWIEMNCKPCLVTDDLRSPRWFYLCPQGYAPSSTLLFPLSSFLLVHRLLSIPGGQGDMGLHRQNTSMWVSCGLMHFIKNVLYYHGSRSSGPDFAPRSESCLHTSQSISFSRAVGICIKTSQHHLPIFSFL